MLMHANDYVEDGDVKPYWFCCFFWGIKHHPSAYWRRDAHELILLSP
jgi:hypothetical protein